MDNILKELNNETYFDMVHCLSSDKAERIVIDGAIEVELLLM